MKTVHPPGIQFNAGIETGTGEQEREGLGIEMNPGRKIKTGKGDLALKLAFTTLQ